MTDKSTDRSSLRATPPDETEGGIFRGFKNPSPRRDDAPATPATPSVKPAAPSNADSAPSSAQATPAAHATTPLGPQPSPQLTPQLSLRRPPPRSLSFSEVEKTRMELERAKAELGKDAVAVLEQMQDPDKSRHAARMLLLLANEQQRRNSSFNMSSPLPQSGSFERVSPGKSSSRLRRPTFTGLETIGEFIPARAPSSNPWDEESRSDSECEDGRSTPGPWLATPERRSKVERIAPLLNVAELDRCPRTGSAGKDKTDRLVTGLQRAIEEAERDHGAESPPVAALLSRLGHVFHSQGRYEEAGAAYRRALHANRRALGALHSNVASALNDLAGLYEAMGQAERAERYYTRAIRILDERGVYGGRTGTAAPPPTRTSSAVDAGAGAGAGAGGIISRTSSGASDGSNGAGRRRASADLTSTPPMGGRLGLPPPLPGTPPGEEAPDLAVLLCNLAGLYCDHGRHDEALPLLERAQRIAARSQGPMSSLYAACTAGLAHVNEALDDPAKARAALRNAISTSERMLGLASTEVVTLYRSLAALCAQTNKDEALKLYHDAIQAREQQLGKDHRALSAWLNALGSLYAQQGQLWDALKQHERALQIDEAALGPDHPDVAGDVSEVATLCARLNRLDDALAYHKRALDIRRRALSKDHREVARDLQNISRVLSAKRKFKEALDFCLEAMELHERVMGPESVQCANDLWHAARLCEHLHRYEEAKNFLARAHTSLAKAADVHYDALDRIKKAMKRIHDLADSADALQDESDEDRSAREGEGSLFEYLCVAGSLRSFGSSHGSSAVASRRPGALPALPGDLERDEEEGAEGPGGCHAFLLQRLVPCVPGLASRRYYSPC
eukprot:tig00021332_g20328.t1